MKLENLDKLAYKIVCDWAKSINFNPVRQGVDYSLIIRFYLWDKVGRALRIKHNLSFNEVEVYNKDKVASPFYHEPLHSKGTYTKPLLKKGKLIYIPFQVTHTDLLIKEFRKLKNYKIISKQITKEVQKKNVVKNLDFKLKSEWRIELESAVFKGLKFFELDLIPNDRELLKNQIRGTLEITQLAFTELKKYKPNALYVHSDNHPPYINYVLVAKKLGIPTFTYQHGLDCELGYLDDCIADYVAVWSEVRKNRYLSDSKIQPEKYKIVGNHLLSISKKKDEKLNNINNKILFITRPHSPIKCYSVSRNYKEGINILEAIIVYLKEHKEVHLLIKPHPMDWIEGYKNVIIRECMEDRIKITFDGLHKLFSEGPLIITEDSTAGAESMYYNLTCIHTHFASSKPTLPFVNYNAAIFASNKKSLVNAIEKGFSLNIDDKEKMKVGQRRFVNDFMPIGDVEDLVTFISTNI